MIKLRLFYERCPHTQSYGGVFDDGINLEGFSYLSFKDMILRLSEKLKENTDVIVALERKENPGQIIELNKQDCDLIRTDPLRAIDAMTVPHRVVKKISKRLRAGYATLAESFGDKIYCKVRSKDFSVECPSCGRWAALDDDGATFCSTNEGGSVFGTGCGFRIQGELIEDKWFAVSTSGLLEQDEARYFLPRKWNKTGPWISHENLLSKFTRYIKEKKNA